MENETELKKKRLLSRLCFIKEDLQAIEKLEIKNKLFSDIIQAIKKRTELLIDLLIKNSQNAIERRKNENNKKS